MVQATIEASSASPSSGKATITAGSETSCHPLNRIPMRGLQIDFYMNDLLASSTDQKDLAKVQEVIEAYIGPQKSKKLDKAATRSDCSWYVLILLWFLNIRYYLHLSMLQENLQNFDTTV